MATKTNKMMDTAVAWFEIPVTNMARAKKFYQQIFEVELEDLDMEEGPEMSMFPVKEGGTGGALIEFEDFYTPSHEGPLVYLAANPDLQHVLDRIEENGGKIINPKTQISDEYGYMAVFEDTEGNRLALHSMK